MHFIRLPLQFRNLPLVCVLVLTAVFAWLAQTNLWFALPLILASALSALGIRDLLQPRHSILRNYPISAHLRFLFEEIRPEIRQYFLEADTDGVPFSRIKRTVVYQRAKGTLDKRPFGTHYNVNLPPFEWLNHSIAAKEPNPEPFRIEIGGHACTKPYSGSIFNISGMSFGALSSNAILALNSGAKKGNFAHDTGEGGISRYHREHGGDLIMQIGSGYYGCRSDDGQFSPERFAAQATLDQVKLIEIKLSQGAKPGHGGVLPGAKVIGDVAIARGVPPGTECVSPPCHSAFSTPIEMMHFIQKLRVLSGGKPVGFKLCVGNPTEILSICKAMLETDIQPDFIVVDGAEGGTGAAPIEFLDHVGMPLRDGLSFVNNALIGCGLRDHIKIGAAGKITSAFDMARVMALGADWCNAARGFMFAIGCIQAQSCHTGSCPTGVATQDPTRQRALVVVNKAERVYRFHLSTTKSLAEVIGAIGLDHPSQIQPQHMSRRITADRVLTYDQIYPRLQPGELLEGTTDTRFKAAWEMASADSFGGAPAPQTKAPSVIPTAVVTSS